MRLTDIFRKSPRRQPDESLDGISKPQITGRDPQGPMTGMFKDYVFRKVSGEFYEALREGIPILDAAINRLVSLNGRITIIGDNAKLVKELEDFCLNVPVNDTQKGIHALYKNISAETFEQGFGFAEFVATPDMSDIAGIRVADSKDIIFRKNKDGVSEPWYAPERSKRKQHNSPESVVNRILAARYGQTVNVGDSKETKLNPGNKIIISFQNENSDPYGISLFRSLEFSSKIFITLENSIGNTAERFGDPAYHLHVKVKATDEAKLKGIREAAQKDFNAVIAAKRKGGSADIVTAGGPDSDVIIKVIGHDGQIMDFTVPIRVVLEQIVSKTSLPAWMLGIYWSTTERMASMEINQVLADAKDRQILMLPEFLKLFSVYLRLRGHKWNTITTSPDKPGDWGFIFETPNITDIVATAQARFLNAQADMMRNNAAAASQTNINVGNASVEIGGMKIPIISSRGCGCHGAKETRHWPELDKVESEYEERLKAGWASLASMVMGILRLPDVEPKAVKSDADEFEFTEDQRKAIMESMQRFIGEYKINNPDSPLKWYYGQAYSLGLIQAASFVGQNRPILDIIKNREIFDELVKTGFTLVKDNATTAIIDRIIPAMESGMLAGENPRTVASRLRKQFDGMNSDWERLARSEMTMSAERAKKDEWRAWNVARLYFRPAPDACAICKSLEGEYPIDDCPLPSADTHPR